MLGLIRTFTPKETKKDSYLVQKLKEAKALVEQGWYQGGATKTINDKTYYCVLGAIGEVTSGLADSKTLYKIFSEANNLAVFGAITTWNDSFLRTKRSVLRGFDKAIALAEKKVCPPLP